MTAGRIVLYGDFNCPWSYLASRRAAVLATDGVEVDWRAVEHEPWRPSRFTDSSLRFTCLHEEMEHVRAELLPGEGLAYSLAGFLPYTQPAVSGYAEAYAAGVAGRVRNLLFEAFWMDAYDLGDATVVRTVTGGPVTDTAWRLVAAWADEWRGTGKETVPVLLVDGAAPLFGTDAVEWLGAELVGRGLEPNPTSRSPRSEVHADA